MIRFIVCVLFIITPCIGISLDALAGAITQENDLAFDVITHEKHLALTASFVLPLTQCQAYRLLTDYDSVEDIPGFVYSNSERLSSNKVRVDRLVEEKILFIPIDVRSTIEFTELPFTGTNFVQTRGNATAYKGSWRLDPLDANSTRLNYSAEIQPGSFIPNILIQHFVSKKLRRNFEALIKVGVDRKNLAFAPCS